jgi:hypothetical protein
MSFHDLTHRSFWAEDTFKVLFNNPYYNVAENHMFEWELSVHYMVMAGIVERNIALLGQLVRK